ncbi:hypothetical protein [Streptomyces subrutilus]|uniref:Uncharacterized protein n=1 Tax=Streptomyces subrutilus TaxID=36818 RepID=A0A1E5NXU3_9ACTN|nr:hypothetical protein [Streptomyces subrutilus]OEJ21072.1 hypothetical protein BGK67_34835 [Streptomyces subrutilus]
MPRKPVVPTHVYEPMAQHLPVDQYRPSAPMCQCGHGHGQPVQQIIVKQADPWARYILLGFAGAGVALMIIAGTVALLIAGGACALCVAAAMKALRGALPAKEKK